jgi:hypothetical protein
LSTIDGVLYGVGRDDGKIKWRIKEKPVINFPKYYEK